MVQPHFLSLRAQKDQREEAWSNDLSVDLLVLLTLT